MEIYFQWNCTSLIKKVCELIILLVELPFQKLRPSFETIYIATVKQNKTKPAILKSYFCNRGSRKVVNLQCMFELAQ